MDDRRHQRARRARNWFVATIACATAGWAVAPASATAALVQVQIDQVTRTGDRVEVAGRVRWNADGLQRHDMRYGDLRLIAVSDRDHRPTVLREESRTVTASGQPFALAGDGVKAGSRVVVTASQHPRTGAEYTARTYVTVADAVAFRTPQANIGRRDCSDIPILPGAQLNGCDLVGADLDGALVSEHDPKADEGKRDSRSTRLLRADLTGATAVRSDFSGASVAGGRLNGIDLTMAKLDNLSLAGAEAVGLRAPRSTSDAKGQDTGANLFGTNLTGAVLDGAIWHGVSVTHADLDGASIRGADWTALFGQAASFRAAHLDGTSIANADVYFSDFTDATLTGSGANDVQLAWVTLCRTALPQTTSYDADRDCRDKVEQPRQDAPGPDRATPYVRIADARLDRSGKAPRVTATISWDTPSFAAGMTVGTVRVVAVDRDTGRAHVIAEREVDPLRATTDDPLAIGDDAGPWLRAGNRIVLTATQHVAVPQKFGTYTGRAYVTVQVLQRGPGRGQIGRFDCSRVALTTANLRGPIGLDFCDLTGAALDGLDLAGRSMRDADLSGATFTRGRMTAVTLDGSAMGDFGGRDAVLTNVNTIQARAPELHLNRGVLRAGQMLFADATDADFGGARLLNSVQMNNVPLRGATFTNAAFDRLDLALADLHGARLDGVDASPSPSSLFLADLTEADLGASDWHVDESGDLPFTWATLCHTTMPDRDGGFSGDRDCPVVPGGESRRRRP